jgi:hypothetical protein
MQKPKGSKVRSKDIVEKEKKGIQKKVPIGARFSAPVQNGSGAHPMSYTNVTGSLSCG